MSNATRMSLVAAALLCGLAAFAWMISAANDWRFGPTLLALVTGYIMILLLYACCRRIAQAVRVARSRPRPIYHKRDETIRGHVFCSFLALLLRKELQDRLGRKEWKLEWADAIRDLDKLVEMEVTIGGKGYVIRGQTAGVEGKVFQACGVALPPVLRQC